MFYKVVQKAIKYAERLFYLKGKIVNGNTKSIFKVNNI